jgi:hypothetical protein
MEAIRLSVDEECCDGRSPPAGAWRAQPCDSRRSPRARLFSKCSSKDVSSSPAALIILRNAGLRSYCARPPGNEVSGTCEEINFGHVTHSVTHSKLIMEKSSKSISSHVPFPVSPVSSWAFTLLPYLRKTRDSRASLHRPPWHACPFLRISALPGCLLWRGLSGTMGP